jgi:hypothetical protein
VTRDGTSQATAKLSASGRGGGGCLTPAAARGVGIGHARDIDKPVERGGDPGPHWAAIANAVRIAEDFKPASVVPFDEPGDQI